MRISCPEVNVDIPLLHQFIGICLNWRKSKFTRGCLTPNENHQAGAFSRAVILDISCKLM